MEYVIWGYVLFKCIISIQLTFVHHLCIDNIFYRLDLECSDGCFPQSTVLAQYHIEISFCVFQAPSEERVRSEG